MTSAAPSRWPSRGGTYALVMITGRSEKTCSTSTAANIDRRDLERRWVATLDPGHFVLTERDERPKLLAQTSRRLQNSQGTLTEVVALVLGRTTHASKVGFKALEPTHPEFDHPGKLAERRRSNPLGLGAR